ncbi:MAG: hypothetical protein FJ294_10380 [Planctomycetes bacterium]|nr:hypothetical protein [Planctomycetota bacterium]
MLVLVVQTRRGRGEGLFLDLLGEDALGAQDAVVAAEVEVRHVAAHHGLDAGLVAGRTGDGHGVALLELDRQVDLVGVLHLRVVVVAARRGDAHGPALVERVDERRGDVHEQVADDAARPLRVAAPAEEHRRIPLGLARGPAPRVPVEGLARDDLVVDAVEPLAALGVAAIRGLREGRLADGVGGDQLLGLPVLAVLQELRAALEDVLRVGEHRRAQLERLLEVVGHRLFAVHIEPRRHRVDGLLAVPVLGRRDQDAVQLLLRGVHLAVVRVAPHIDALRLLRELDAALEVGSRDIADRHDLHALLAFLRERADALQVAVAHGGRARRAHADDCDADRLAILGARAIGAAHAYIALFLTTAACADARHRGGRAEGQHRAS